MPDTDTKFDPLAAAFASFASGARGEILIPGASTVRRTVARRRRGTAVAGGLAVVLVAGGIGHGATTHHRPVRPLTSPVVVAPSSPRDGTVAPRLAALALATAINAPRGAGTRTETIGNGIFQQAGTLEDIDPTVRPPGTYTLIFACAGSGTATITWTVGLTTTTVAFACDTPPHLPVHTSVIRSTAPRGIAVTVRLDGPADDTYGGAAYRVDAIR